MSKTFLVALLLSTFGLASASRLDKAYQALSQFDYFSAKELFYQANKKKADPYASFGLAVIFHRNDNPFYSLDSAVRYINLANEAFSKNGEGQLFGMFRVDGQTLRQLADSIANRVFLQVRNKHSVTGYNHFLKSVHLALNQLKEQVVVLRDELEFSAVKSINKSDSTAHFIVTHPESRFRAEALSLFERQVFEESTVARNASSYLDFLRKNKTSSVRHLAFEKLFNIYRDKKDITGLSNFVAEFPEAPQNLEAWKLLFSLSVKAYSFSELKRFIDQYPTFPLRSTILRELELNKLVLYPYVRNDLTGFIDENGEMKIQPAFEAATPFSQGLTLLHKGDSVYFVNKDNKNPFNRGFEEAAPFRNGLAPVKSNGYWVFINPLGVVVSKRFEEIGEWSDEAYVVKRNGIYGVVDQFGQILIEPRFEKLGDLVNGVAYYTQDGAYGFVTPDGYTHPPEFDWVSDFSGYGVAVIKVKGRFGLVHRSGHRLLEAVFEQVIRQNDTLYLVVDKDLYGFYAVSGCFVHALGYDYLPVFQSAPLTNGTFFKLHRKKQQALADANGTLHTAWGIFEEVYLPSGGLMRVKKKGRFGYADTKGNVVIPCSFDQVADFSGNCAIVKSKDKYSLINHSGKEVYSSDKEIRNLGKSHFTCGEEPVTIINSEGTVLFFDATNIQRVADGIYAFERAGGEIRLIYD